MFTDNLSIGKLPINPHKLITDKLSSIIDNYRKFKYVTFTGIGRLSYKGFVIMITNVAF